MSRKEELRHWKLLDGMMFSIAPILFLIVGVLWTKGQGPQWLGRNFENSYPYLLNSLAIVKGKPAWWVDHPGTTTQIFGAVVLRASAVGSPTRRLVNGVLTNPERYIALVHGAELVFSCLVLWFFPWWASITAGARVVGLLIQAPVFFFHGIVQYIGWFGSDLMLVPMSIAAVSTGAVLIHQQLFGRREFVTVALMGVVCGLGIATKLTFFPTILLAVFICRGRRDWLILGCAFLATCAVTFVPIYPSLAKLFNWSIALSTHSGYYGSGPVGVPSPQRYLLDLSWLAQAEPCLSMILVAAVLAITLGIVPAFRTPKHPYARMPLTITAVVLAIQIFSFIAITKHPRVHYLFVLEISLGFDLLLLFEAIRSTENLRWIRMAAAFVLIALLAAGFWHGAETLDSGYRSLRLGAKGDLAFYKRAKRRAGDDLIVGYYRSLSPEFALCFANDFSGKIFAKDLQNLYPKAVSYKIFSGRFETFTESFEPATIEQRYAHFFLLGDRPLGTANDPGLSYFKRPITELLENQAGYSLEEWHHPRSINSK
jgi:hypothetical protein